MDITLIAALSENNVIGLNGKIPWKISEDLQRFKELTLGHPVIMGRKTYDSIPKKFRPLPQRRNIILSKTLPDEGGIYVARNMQEAIRIAEESLYVIGGEEVYKQFLPLANKLELTRVHENYDGDSFFPDLNWEEWNQTNQESRQTEEGLRYSFLTYRRISG